MIHGAFCGGWVFDGWRTSFEARGYRVETPTLRHHDCGRDPPESLGTTSLLDYVADLEELISSLAEPPILLGHSMGGLLAQVRPRGIRFARWCCWRRRPLGACCPRRRSNSLPPMP